MSLLVVGTVAFDKVETCSDKTDKILGGAATYIGLAASHLTKDVRLVSIVGGDFPEKYFDVFRARHIDISGIQIVPDGKTFYWSGRYHNNMNNRDTLCTDLNVLAGFDPMLPSHYCDSRYVMLGNLTPCVQKKVIDQMHNRPQIICMDTMNFWMNTTMDDLLSVIRMVDVLAVNEEEARQLSGEYSLLLAARKIQDLGPGTVIIKRGEYGALLFHHHEVFHAPALPLAEVKDPTGAGDAFAGGFMGYLSKTNDTSFNNLKKAVIYGSALASFVVEKFGTIGLVKVSSDDISHRLQAFVKLVSFAI